MYEYNDDVYDGLFKLSQAYVRRYLFRLFGTLTLNMVTYRNNFFIRFGPLRKYVCIWEGRSTKVEWNSLRATSVDS